jgi:hypothetical protein
LEARRLAWVSNPSAVVVVVGIRRNARKIKITSSTTASTIPWSGIVCCFYINLPFLQKFPHPHSHHFPHFHRNRLHLPHQLKIHQKMGKLIKHI